MNTCGSRVAVGPVTPVGGVKITHVAFVFSSVSFPSFLPLLLLLYVLCSSLPFRFYSSLFSSPLSCSSFFSTNFPPLPSLLLLIYFLLLFFYTSSTLLSSLSYFFPLPPLSSLILLLICLLLLYSVCSWSFSPLAFFSIYIFFYWTYVKEESDIYKSSNA